MFFFLLCITWNFLINCCLFFFFLSFLCLYRYVMDFIVICKLIIELMVSAIKYYQLSGKWRVFYSNLLVQTSHIPFEVYFIRGKIFRILPGCRKSLGNVKSSENSMETVIPSKCSINPNYHSVAIRQT